MNDFSQTSPPSGQYARRVWIAVGIISLFGLILWLIGSSFDVLLLLLSSILIALPLRAGAHWLSQRTPLAEGIALALVGLVVVAVFVGVGLLVSPSIASQTQQLQRELPNVLTNAKQQFQQTSWGSQLLDKMPSSPEKLFQRNSESSKLVGEVFGIVSSTISTLTNFYVVFFLALFLAAQPSLYVDGLVKLVPPNGRQRARHILDKIGTSLLGWLGGTLMSMTIVGLMSWLGLSLLDVRLAGILALFAALITFIPNLGPVLALIPALLFALLDGPQQALYVFVLYIGIQTIESNVITPLIQKRLNDIPPALLLVVQIIVGAFAGTLGLIMAAPLLVITIDLVKYIYIQDILGDE